MKRIKNEIRPDEPNRPIGEPNRPMSTSPKRVEPILCLGPWQNEDPDLPTTFQETWSTRMKLGLQGWSLLYKDETWSTRMKLALQGWNLVHKDEACSTRDEACSTRMKLGPQGRSLLYKGWSLLYKDEACSTRMKLAPQGKETGPHYYKKASTSSQKGTRN